MYLVNSPDIPDGHLRATVNPGDAKPFATIYFDGINVRLADLSVADCDRLIRAAVNAKRRLERAISGTPHEYRHAADGGHCDACGLLKGNAIHASCPAVAEHAGVTCALPPGHGGRHESGQVPAIVWGPGVTEPDAAAVLADAIDAGTPVVVDEDVTYEVCAEIHPSGNYMCELPKGHDDHHNVPSADDGSGDIAWAADEDVAEAAR